MNGQGLIFYPNSHRYKLDGQWCPGVTTLIKDGLPNKNLMYWSARAVAEYVADNPDTVEAMRAAGRNSLIAALKEVPWTARDTAQIKGTEIHNLAEQLVAGNEVEVPEHLAGYVEACVDFLDTWRPHPIIVERPLAHRAHWWAGKPDLFASLPDDRIILFDYKTAASGIWPETAFQLAAYSHAEFYTAEDGTEHPIPQADLCAAVWLRADGYDVIPVRADDQVYKEFRHLAYVANAAKRAKGTQTELGYIGQPLNPPPSKEEPAA